VFLEIARFPISRREPSPLVGEGRVGGPRARHRGGLRARAPPAALRTSDVADVRDGKTDLGNTRDRCGWPPRGRGRTRGGLPPGTAHPPQPRRGQPPGPPSPHGPSPSDEVGAHRGEDVEEGAGFDGDGAVDGAGGNEEAVAGGSPPGVAFDGDVEDAALRQRALHVQVRVGRTDGAGRHHGDVGRRGVHRRAADGDDVGAGRGERHGDRPADAGVGAGDDRAAAGEAEGEDGRPGRGGTGGCGGRGGGAHRSASIGTMSMSVWSMLSPPIPRMKE